jgi:hypothetical protein
MIFVGVKRFSPDGKYIASIQISQTGKDFPVSLHGEGFASTM